MRDIIQLAVDAFRNGKLYKRCHHCRKLKEINEFGLRRKVGMGKNGADVIAVQAWCVTCRSEAAREKRLKGLAEVG